MVWGLALAADRQRINRFIQPTVKVGYLLPGQPDAETLDKDAENHMLTSVKPSSLPCSWTTFSRVITRRPNLRPSTHDFLCHNKDDHNYNLGFFISY